MTAPIFLFTNFHTDSPYVGQIHSAILDTWPSARIIDLMHDAPKMNPRASTYLLATMIRDLPANTTVIAIVDPGVGSARDALLVQANGRRLIRPDNRLLEITMHRTHMAEHFVLEWRPDRLSATFHGRDLFAPAAARWAAKRRPACTPSATFADSHPSHDWPDNLARILYIDAYGNTMTSLRTATLPDPVHLTLPDNTAPPRAHTFSNMPPHFSFWYENSLGLAEIAVNGGSAAKTYGLHVGDVIRV